MDVRVSKGDTENPFAKVFYNKIWKIFYLFLTLHFIGFAWLQLNILKFAEYFIGAVSMNSYYETKTSSCSTLCQVLCKHYGSVCLSILFLPMAII